MVIGETTERTGRPAVEVAGGSDLDWPTLVHWCRRNPQAGRVSVPVRLVVEVADRLDAIAGGCVGAAHEAPGGQ